MISLNLPRTVPRPEVEVKALPFYPQDAGYWWGSSLPSTQYNYRRDVGMGLDSNVVMSPVMWVMRTFTEATAVIQSDRGEENEVWKKVKGHPLKRLIEDPNEFYDGDALWKATCVDYLLTGNAYWRKVRNRIGDVLQLWYVPSRLIDPRSPADGSDFISHYEYRPMGGQQPINLAPRDVVHFRFGLDLRDPRFGMSPLQSLFREIFIDDEAANYSAKLLANEGVAGMVISPKGADTRPTEKELDKFKEYVRAQFTGDNRGKALVMGLPTDVFQYGVDPSKMALEALRDISEERVCSALGIDAAIVGFGSGRQATKVGATMRELVKLAWVGCLNPMQRSMGRQVTRQLLPDFQAQTQRFRMWFDTSEVEVFTEERAVQIENTTRAVMAGVLRVDRAQEELGYEVDSTQKIYLRPSNSLPIDEHGELIQGAAPNGTVDQRGTEGEGDGEAVPAAIANRMNGNGNGRKPEEED
jgi:HK97 family phage portal protein